MTSSLISCWWDHNDSLLQLFSFSCMKNVMLLFDLFEHLCLYIYCSQLLRQLSKFGGTFIRISFRDERTFMSYFCQFTPVMCTHAHWHRSDHPSGCKPRRFLSAICLNDAYLRAVIYWTSPKHMLRETSRYAMQNVLFVTLSTFILNGLEL